LNSAGALTDSDGDGRGPDGAVGLPDGEGRGLLAGAAELGGADEIDVTECWLSAATLGLEWGLSANAAPAMATTATAAVLLAAMR
jgi:hypothetical protein